MPREDECTGRSAAVALTGVTSQQHPSPPTSPAEGGLSSFPAGKTGAAATPNPSSRRDAAKGRTMGPFHHPPKALLALTCAAATWLLALDGRGWLGSRSIGLATVVSSRAAAAAPCPFPRLPSPACRAKERELLQGGGSGNRGKGEQGELWQMHTHREREQTEPCGGWHCLPCSRYCRGLAAARGGLASILC